MKSLLSKTKLFLLVSLFLLTACTKIKSPFVTDVNALIPITLQLKWFHQFQFAGYYAAIEQGYYREAGLDVTLVEGDPGKIPQTVDEVLSGRAQYGITNSDLLLERAAGKPVILLASIFQHSPAALAVREESNITTPQQVRNLNLYLSDTFRTAELQAMLLNEGVGLQRNNLLPPDNYPSYLFDEEADGFGVYMTNEPFLLEQAGRSFVYIDPQRYGIDFYGDVLYTTESQIQENPEQVAQFMAASLRGWEYAMANQEELVDLIVTEYGSSKSREHLLFEAAAMENLILPDLVAIGHTNPGRWQHIADTYTQLGFMPANFSLDGFIYDPPGTVIPRNLYWAVGIFAGLFVVTLSASGAISIFSRKLQHTVAVQTTRLAEQNYQLTQEVQTRAQAEEALRKSEAQFRVVWETAVDAMALSDADGIVTVANPAYLSLYKLTPEQAINQPFSVIFPEAERANAEAQYKEIFANAPDFPEAFEAEVQLGDGQTAWVESRISFIKANGKRVAMLSLVRNVTQRVLAEKERQELQKILTDAEALAGIGSWKYDFDTRKLTFSNEIRRIFCVEGTHQECEGDLREIVTAYLPEKEVASLEVLVRVAMTSESPPAHEFEIQLLDGRTRTLLTKMGLLDEGRAIFGYVQDITEQKQSEAHQAELTMQLRQAQKMESVGRLAGGLAHDFNNQLAVVHLYTDLLLADESIASQQQLKLKNIRQATDHAANLTRQLLAFSRQQVLHPVSLDLNHLIIDLQRMLVRIIGEDIILQTVLLPDLHPIMADPVQIEQVIMNLIINARDAMPAGGQLTIQTENCLVNDPDDAAQLEIKPGAYVCLTLTDTGTGIDNPTLKKIFEPFFTTKEVGKGTGLGLATVHGIVKQSDGAIWVESELGIGTTFKVYLATCEQPAQNVGVTEDQVNIPYGQETILLVEDEDFLRNMLQETLTEWGYTVLVAKSGLHAQELLETHPDKIDLLLTDVVMPHLSGPELAQSLSARQADLNVIFMTGYANRDSHTIISNLARQELLNKPFSLKSLASALKRVLHSGVEHRQ